MDLGPLEIILIVVAVILVFGVGKLGNIGGALGKSIREFHIEKDRPDEIAQTNIKQARKEETPQTEAKSQN